MIRTSSIRFEAPMLKTIIGLVIFCLGLPFMLYALTHVERIAKKQAARLKGKRWVLWTYSENEPLSVFYLWFSRLVGSIVCVGLVYAIFVFAFRLASGHPS
jgi:hypothetical protein